MLKYAGSQSRSPLSPYDTFPIRIAMPDSQLPSTKGKRQVRQMFQASLSSHYRKSTTCERKVRSIQNETEFRKYFEERQESCLQEHEEYLRVAVKLLKKVGEREAEGMFCKLNRVYDQKAFASTQNRII